MAEPTRDTTSVPAEAAAGAAAYSPFVLAVYDLEVLGFELPFIFKCPSRRILDFYDEHVTDCHLDVGVGTGYFLDKCRFPVERPVVHLMDLSRNSLDKTAGRVRRYLPVVHHCNVLEPIEGNLPRFGSIGAANFLHCLPGTMLDKEAVFRNLKPLLRPGGVLFGTTVLGQGVDVGPLYRLVNRAYNRAKIFSNLSDGAGELETILARNYARSSVSVVGSMAFFVARD
jgi:SAM-dependent methyltransferase